MRRGIILKIGLSIFAIAIIILGVIYIYKPFETKDITESGTITIELVDKNGSKEEKTLDFTKEDTLIDILEKNFDVTMGNGAKEGMILKINNVDCTQNNDAYIMILVNCTYSQVGVMRINLKDGEKITFKYTRLEDHDYGC